MNFKLCSFFLLMGIFLVASCTKENIDQTKVTDPTVDPTVVMCNMVVQIQNDSGVLAPIVIGGLAPFIIEWPDKIDSTSFPDTLFAPKTNGDYSVIVTDAQGCIITETINVTNADPCHGYGAAFIGEAWPDRTITVTPLRGTPPYSFLWSNGDTTNSIVLNDSVAYQLTLTDALGCVLLSGWLGGGGTDPCSSVYLTIVELPPGSGILYSSVGGAGVPPYSYIWSTGEITDKITVVNDGIYSVTATDGNGCIVDASLDYMNPCTSFSVTVAEQPPGSGDLFASPTDGIAPYSYLWSNNETTESITVTGPGTYSVTVTDSAGCETEGSIVL